jgi:outer membrane protein assembly factor BamB
MAGEMHRAAPRHKRAGEALAAPGESGQALVLALLALALGVVLVSAFLLFVSTSQRFAQAAREQTTDHYCADGGVDHALWRLINEGGFTANYAISLNQQTVEITVTSVTGEDTTRIRLSTEDSADIGALSFEDGDLVRYHPVAAAATLLLDEDDLFGPWGDGDIDAAHVLDNGHIALSTDSDVWIGWSWFEDGDLIDYDPVMGTATTLLNEDELFGPGREDIDAVHVIDSDHFILSTETDARIGALSFEDGDLVEYELSTGTATLFFDEGTFEGPPGRNENIDAVHVLDNGDIILSTDGRATLDFQDFDDGDLIHYDPGTGTATLFFDEDWFSGPGNEDIDAAHVLHNGEIVLSTDGNATLGTATSSEDGDVVEYELSTGTATIFLHEDAVFSGNEDIDAVHVLDNGHIVLSTETNARIGALSFDEDDLVQYDPSTGTAAMLFNGGDVFASNENIDAVHVLDNGHIILSTEDQAVIGTLPFTEGDLVEYDPVMGTATVLLDEQDVFGWWGANIDAAHILDNDHIILSTDDNASIGWTWFEDGDLIDYDPTTGTASLFFDEDLLGGDEDVDAVHVVDPVPEYLVTSHSGARTIQARTRLVDGQPLVVSWEIIP